MKLGKHTRTQKGAFRRERGDSLVKNLKKEYSKLEKFNGNTKLATLKKKYGVTSLSKLLEKV